MEPTIRLAHPSDAEALTSLSDQLGYPTDPDTVRENLARLAAMPDHVVLVAELDGAVAGWLHAREEWALETGGHAEIAGLVIEAARRNLGLGKRLVAAAESWARARGLRRIRVRSRLERDDAHRFYRRLGYHESKVQTVLDRHLDGHPHPGPGPGPGHGP